MEQLLNLYAQYLKSKIILAFEAGIPHIIDGVVNMAGGGSVIRCSYLEHGYAADMRRGFVGKDVVVLSDFEKADINDQDAAMREFMRCISNERSKLILEVDRLENLGPWASSMVCKVNSDPLKTWESER